MSNQIPHSEMVCKLVKDPRQIIETMTPGKMNLVHMAMGVSGESGELLDAIKKFSIYNKPLDRKNVIEELGDLEFYMEGIRQQLSITREEVLCANIEKLAERYKKFEYSDQQAINRADKSPAKIMAEGAGGL